MRYSVVELVSGKVISKSALMAHAYELRDEKQDESLQAGFKLTSARFALRPTVR